MLLGDFEYLKSDPLDVKSFFVAAALDKANALVGRGLEKLNFVREVDNFSGDGDESLVSILSLSSELFV